MALGCTFVQIQNYGDGCLQSRKNKIEWSITQTILYGRRRRNIGSKKKWIQFKFQSESSD